MRRVLLLIVILLVLVGGVVGLYLLLTPQVISVSPQDGDVDVRAGASVQIAFSRPMQEDSVLERLEFTPPRLGEFDWQENTLIFTPHQPWPNGETVAVSLAEGAWTDGVVSLAMRSENQWSFTIGQPRLAYLYPSDASANIYVFNTLSGESEQLTDFLGGVQDFHVHLNGNAIYYSVRNGPNNSRIYRLGLDGEEGGEPVLVVDCPQANCRDVHVSPHGDYLAYERTASVGSDDPAYPQVWLMPLSVDGLSPGPQGAGGSAYRVGDDLPQTTSPHWSPNGLLTYYDFSEEAFVIFDPRTGELAYFENQTGQAGDWHPNGQVYAASEIFFVQVDESDTSLDTIGSSHILLFNLDDGTSGDLTQMDTLEDTAPVFSPDGSFLAIARKFLTIERWTPGRQIWLLDPDQSGAQQLTDEPFYNHFNFSWNPSGDQLAYVRFNQAELTEAPEIWIIDPITKQNTSLIEGGFAPQWIP